MNAALPVPEPGPHAAVAWTERHLADVLVDRVAPSPAFRGGQVAADAALDGFDLAGYARDRNEVLPRSGRGASRLSPYIRHGLLSLPAVWDAVADGPGGDVRKFRDELLWQEYARHVYARLGHRTARGLRGEPRSEGSGEPWDRSMACVDASLAELETEGWLVNQARMWLASEWTVRHGADWRHGEDHFYRHLLDGSRAANRLGWQWTVGAATRRPYGFSRRQVERRAPELCRRCGLRDDCPVEDWPDDRDLLAVRTPTGLLADPDPEATAGPSEPSTTGSPEAVWITAESMGDDDPALAAHPDLPAVFVFDLPLLERLRLSSKRLVFLVETLADLATRRPLEVHGGAPTDLLGGRPLAATAAPVPGWRRIAAAVDVAAVHPWPWLVPPHGGRATSFSAWRKAARA
ncbi:MAG: FAD-binding domain-containing protein [Acidimicrobiia bacterium]|nr:FAD-binding domain-containing protein [Acidimicrobiia bacterium]